MKILSNIYSFFLSLPQNLKIAIFALAVFAFTLVLYALVFYRIENAAKDFPILLTIIQIALGGGFVWLIAKHFSQKQFRTSPIWKTMLNKNEPNARSFKAMAICQIKRDIAHCSVYLLILKNEDAEKAIGDLIHNKTQTVQPSVLGNAMRQIRAGKRSKELSAFGSNVFKTADENSNIELYATEWTFDTTTEAEKWEQNFNPVHIENVIQYSGQLSSNIAEKVIVELEINMFDRTTEANLANIIQNHLKK